LLEKPGSTCYIVDLQAFKVQHKVLQTCYMQHLGAWTERTPSWRGGASDTTETWAGQVLPEECNPESLAMWLRNHLRVNQFGTRDSVGGTATVVTGTVAPPQKSLLIGDAIGGDANLLRNADKKQ
jgi:hypothetical protein